MQLEQLLALQVGSGVHTGDDNSWAGMGEQVVNSQEKKPLLCRRQAEHLLLLTWPVFSPGSGRASVGGACVPSPCCPWQLGWEWALLLVEPVRRLNLFPCLPLQRWWPTYTAFSHRQYSPVVWSTQPLVPFPAGTHSYCITEPKVHSYLPTRPEPTVHSRPLTWWHGREPLLCWPVYCQPRHLSSTWWHEPYCRYSPYVVHVFCVPIWLAWTVGCLLKPDLTGCGEVTVAAAGSVYGRERHVISSVLYS